MRRSFFDDPGIRVTLWGSLLNLFLAIVKLIGGTLGNSTALIADAFHSLSDLLNDGVVMLTYHVGRMPKDQGHPYGHGRAENIGAAVIGVAVLAVGVHIVQEVWVVIVEGDFKFPNWAAAIIALVSVGSKEFMFRYMRRVGEQLSSPSILANAWDQRSDAISSIATFIGIFGAILGFPLMDPLAGGVVALMIFRIGYTVLAKAVRDLMDSSLEEHKVRDIRNTIHRVPGVLRSHELKTRRIGGQILIDVHILVDPEILVSEGHKIAETVRRELIRDWDNVLDVMVHVDTEDDATIEQLYTAGREQLTHGIPALISATPGILACTKTRVHFYQGKNILELVVNVEEGKTLMEMRGILEEFKFRLKQTAPIDHVRVYIDPTKP